MITNVYFSCEMITNITIMDTLKQELQTKLLDLERKREILHRK